MIANINHGRRRVGHAWTQDRAPKLGVLSQRCARCSLVRYWTGASQRSDRAIYVREGIESAPETVPACERARRVA